MFGNVKADTKSALLLLCLVFVALGQTPPIANTHCGPVQGRYNANLESSEFLGIPYAQSTKGNKRWSKPKPLSREDNTCWKGTLSATQFGAMCPQMNIAGWPVGNEDCLSIDVWTTNLPRSSSEQDLLPVMVFIHGGSYVEGQSFSPPNTAYKMVRKKRVVSVSIQYRLGALGFLATQSLSHRTGNTSDPSGNYGVMDQALALHWVQANIKNFGGDPNRITLYGHSSGGTAVFMLLASPLFLSLNPITKETKPLFHNAISMSGSPLIDKSLADAQRDNTFIVKRTKCNNTSTLEDELQCLYNLPYSDLVRASMRSDLYPYWNTDSNSVLPFPDDYQPGIAIVDGYVLKQDMLKSLGDTNNPSNKVPVVVGTMAQEIESVTSYDLVQLAMMNSTQYYDFLLKWPKFTDSVVRTLWNLYPMEQYQNKVDLNLLTMTTDIRVTCGNIAVARALASVNDERSVYFYNSPQHFRDPVFVAPLRLRYAYHGLDCMLLMDLYDLIPTTITPDIVDCSNVLFDSFTYFAANGIMDKTSFWKPFGTKGAEFSNIVQGFTSHTITNFKKDQCQYFRASGWDSEWWAGQ